MKTINLWRTQKNSLRQGVRNFSIGSSYLSMGTECFNVKPNKSFFGGYLILLVSISILSSCKREVNTEVGFAERIIDNDAPDYIWIKTAGDINRDGKIDLLAGGWKVGGIAAYLAPDWK